jgi:hypothetical protein
MLFLFALGAFLIKGSLKKWLVAATLFSIVLSWGKNFGFLTDLFIDYVPLYNKFRAVSSIQVIAELCVPLLGILGLAAYLSDEHSKVEKFKAFKNASIVVGGLALFFTAFGSNLFAFESYRDPGFENMLEGLSAVLIEDRRTIFFQDSLRSLIYVSIAAAVLWLFLEDKIKRNVVLGSMLVLVLLDLVAVDWRYVNEDDFISKSRLEKPFQLSPVKEAILKDKDHYRVMNFMVNPMNDGSTSFFFNSVGGYHAAKPRRYQELFDFQIARNNIEVLNMLNTKYIIYPGEENQESVQLNEDANGNAWFDEDIVCVETADEEIKALDSLDTKRSAVVNTEFEKELQGFQPRKELESQIELTSYAPNEIRYRSRSESEQLAVFSEMYYKNGWNAYVDGELMPHFRVNYVLRALRLAGGEHEIIFRFEPGVIEVGNRVTLTSYFLLLLIPGAWYLIDRKRNVQSYPQKTV